MKRELWKQDRNERWATYTLGGRPAEANCPLALRGNPGVFALGASVDPALGRIGGAAVRSRATGAHPELVQSAIKCH